MTLAQQNPDELYDTFDKNLYRIQGTQPGDEVMNMMQADASVDNSSNVQVSGSDIGSGVNTSTTVVTTGSQQAGKKLYNNTEPGYILGVDPQDGLAKFYIGNTAAYLNWDGENLVFTGKSRQVMRVSTIFESLTRFTTLGSGTATATDRGLKLTPTSTMNRSIEVNIPVNDSGTGSSGFDSFSDTSFTAIVTLATEGAGDGWFYIGITEVNAALTATSTTGAFSKKQYGFKAFKGTGQTLVYATSGNGSGEQETFLMEINGGQTYFLSAVCNASGSVEFKAIFGSIDSGSIYTATHTTFPPETATYSVGTFFVNNQGSANVYDWIINSYSFEKFSTNLF